MNYTVLDSNGNAAALVMFNSDGTCRVAFAGSGDDTGTYTGSDGVYEWDSNCGPGYGKITWCSTHNCFEWTNDQVPTYASLRL